MISMPCARGVIGERGGKWMDVEERVCGARADNYNSRARMCISFFHQFLCDLLDLADHVEVPEVWTSLIVGKVTLVDLPSVIVREP